MPSPSAVLPFTTIRGSLAGDAGILNLKSRWASAHSQPASSRLPIGGDYEVTLLAEDKLDLRPRELHVKTVKTAKQPEDEHVFAAPWISYDFQAFDLHRDLVDRVALFDQFVVHTDIGCRDRRIRIRSPLVLQQIMPPDFISLACKRPSRTCSLKATMRSAWSPPFVTVAARHANTVAARAFDTPRRRLNLGRDDFHGPDAVAHPGCDGPEGLTALLGALTGIAEDLDDMLIDCHRRLARRYR